MGHSCGADGRPSAKKIDTRRESADMAMSKGKTARGMWNGFFSIGLN